MSYQLVQQVRLNAIHALLDTSVSVSVARLDASSVLRVNFLLLELPRARTAKWATGLNKQQRGPNTPASGVLEAILARPSSASTAATSVTVASILSQETGRNALSVPSAVILLDTVLLGTMHQYAPYVGANTNLQVLAVRVLAYDVQMVNTLTQEIFVPGAAKGDSWY